MSFSGSLRRLFSSPKAFKKRKKGPVLGLEALEDRTVPTLIGNGLFPADNPWNEKITNAPVAANSATLVASIGAGSALHADFGTTWAGALNGIPVNVVPGSQPKVNVVIDAYPTESDLVPVPIPANAVIEGDPLPAAQNTGDRHLIVFDQNNNIGYELYNAHRPSETADHQWHADSEAVWNYAKDSFRTPGFTSADAAGLPILPGLIRPDEVLDQGIITHALRFTVARTDNAYVAPASHYAGSNDPSLPRMGERFRLKQSFDISHFSKANQVILQALKDYGMIVADNGSNWYVSGQPSPRWDDGDLHSLAQLVGANFEAVDLTYGGAGSGTGSGSTGGTGGRGGPGLTANQRFVAQVYLDILNRPVDGAGQAAWSSLLDQGASRTLVVSAIQGSLEYRQEVVQGLYQKVLGRSADGGGLNFWASYLGQGGSDEQLESLLYASGEFFSQAGGTTTGFIQALYGSLLNRGAGLSEVQFWTTALGAGDGRGVVALGFLTSTERYAGMVQVWYGSFLHRTADSGGVSNFVAALQGGASDESVILALVSSDEYFAKV